jgi:pimeloyl-ACP methyl ester carboxylesterase
VNATYQSSRQAGVQPTIVLVHGAFADASSWNGVIERLQQQGYTVIAPAADYVVRSMAQRAGADIVEVEGSHVIMISQPQAVTDHILKAARAAASPRT